MTRFVGIHGVGNYRPADTPEDAARRLSKIWHRHLAVRLPSIAADQVNVAYFADQLRPVGRQGGNRIDNLTADAEWMLRRWLEAVGVPLGVPQGWGTMPLRQALSWIAERRRLSPRLVEIFVALFFREVSAYLDPLSDSIRRAAKERVITAVRQSCPSVVLAHSLGSIVAYEALWSYPEAEVDLLVTLGSPLALPHAVFHRLEPKPHDGRGMRPPGVTRWVNIADPGDLVALPPRGVSQRFRNVDADAHDVTHPFDFHLVANYLKCSELASALHNYV